jgi:hypothetical protein
MPFAFEYIALRSQVADNSADFMGEKSRIDRDREVMQPEFGFGIAGADVDMRRFAAFVRIKERPIRSPAQHGGHSVLVIRLVDKVGRLRGGGTSEVQFEQLGERIFL